MRHLNKVFVEGYIESAPRKPRSKNTEDLVLRIRSYLARDVFCYLHMPRLEYYRDKLALGTFVRIFGHLSNEGYQDMMYVTVDEMELGAVRPDRVL